MWQNASYVFFRELKGAEQAKGPLGAMQAPLTPGRSLAVDPGHHALGLPIYVSADGMKHVNKAGVFNRLMVAQDVGSAIKGPERGDIYFGSGDAAGRLAGVTKHAGKFIVLLPNDTPARAERRRARQPRRKPGNEPGRPEVRRWRSQRHRGRGPALGARDTQPRSGQGQAARRHRACSRSAPAPAPTPASQVPASRKAPAAAREPSDGPAVAKAKSRQPRAARRLRPPQGPPDRLRQDRGRRSHRSARVCASATPARACAPSCSPPTPRATRPCWSSPARAARSPPTASAL